jgi:hypothetical protein
LGTNKQDSKEEEQGERESKTSARLGASESFPARLTLDIVPDLDLPSSSPLGTFEEHLGGVPVVIFGQRRALGVGILGLGVRRVGRVTEKSAACAKGSPMQISRKRSGEDGRWELESQYRVGEGRRGAGRTRTGEDRLGSFAGEGEVVVGLHAEENGAVLTGSQACRLKSERGMRSSHNKRRA